MGQWTINRFQETMRTRWYVGFIQASHQVWYTSYDPNSKVCTNICLVHFLLKRI